MSQESDVALRKALDEVDRSRRWQVVAIIVVLVALLLKILGFGAWFYRSRAPNNSEIEIVLVTGLQFMVFTVLFCTLGVCIFVSRMTRKVLLAIHLSSRS